ncbi:hypothetical protein C0J52_06202 [Blattella germanica]|nr:hypothetical protein C0J52_06202 [Blattella germanica]
MRNFGLSIDQSGAYIHAQFCKMDPRMADPEMFRFGSNIQDCDDTREYAIFNSIYGSGNISSSVMISSI